MPVLEGMASGLACVATNCLGVQTFAQHGVNALLADTQARPSKGHRISNDHFHLLQGMRAWVLFMPLEQAAGLSQTLSSLCEPSRALCSRPAGAALGSKCRGAFLQLTQYGGQSDPNLKLHRSPWLMKLLLMVQDVEHLARLLLTVLVEDSLRQRLAIAARATALQFAPSIIADRCACTCAGLSYLYLLIPLAACIAFTYEWHGSYVNAVHAARRFRR